MMNKLPLLMGLCLATSLGAQTTLVGTVRDSQNHSPLPGANVVISGGRLSFDTGAAADQNGEYRIPNLSPGTYRLQVLYIGYREYEEEVVITAESGPELEINPALDLDAIRLQEFVVTASRGKREKLTDAPAAISVITSVEIERRTNPNLGDYFKYIKGVDFTASGIDGFNLSARGFNTSFSSRLLTLTDGRKANVPSLRLIAYNTIPTSSDDVDQIEVVLGPSSALYGPNAFAGVINIITKKPRFSTGTSAGVSYGNRDYRKWQVRHAGTRGRLGYKISLVDFSASDWEWIDPEEKKGHHDCWNPRWGDCTQDLDDPDYPYQWIWDGYDIRIDRNGNGRYYDPADSLIKGVDHIRTDLNRDGIPDLPEFSVENQRVDLRLDYDFDNNHSLIYSYGRARATNINITGVARFLADNWIYQNHQLRYIRNNLFVQTYLNISDAGQTRNLRDGSRIFDKSTFYHLQLQYTLEELRLLGTQVSFGFDYQRTMPKTFGSILPDGKAGKSFDEDGKDNDGDGDVDEYAEGLIITNEYGLYFQSTSQLTRSLELVLASRLDLHTGVQDSANGMKFLADPLLGGTVPYAPQISPKVGLLWKPAENQTFRLTAARAFNTPSSQGLYLDMLVGQVVPFGVKARGNADGFHYTRNPAGELMMFDTRASSDPTFVLSDIPEGAILYIPPVLGRPAQFVQVENVMDIEAVRSEGIFTLEAGYIGILGSRLRLTLDIYHSWYADFISDLTWITPVVLDTADGLDNAVVIGIISTEEHNGLDPGPDGKFGTEDDFTDLTFESPMELILTNINYGEVDLGGVDLSIYYIASRSLSGEFRMSYLGEQAFDNPLTGVKDPINAPSYKLSASLNYTDPGERWWAGLSFRHIPTFDWSAGVFYGTIESYTVIDVNMGYRINDLFTLKTNLNNVTNDVHREIVGGAELGRQIVVNLSVKM